ncbi:Leucine-rich repeat and IQ domain-containing protein 1 [Mactra antiquata]
MIMPPSGIDGAMDDDAVIEAEIYHELENINLDDEIPPEPDVDDIDEQHDLEENNFDVQNELDDYIKKLQDQSNRFEEELLECDDLLAHNTDKTGANLSSAIVPYDDHDFLSQLAKEHGCDVEEYKRKILEDIENDEVIIEDELKDFIDNDDDVSNDDTELDQDAKLPVRITQAVEDGMDNEEIPVSQDLVAVNGVGTTHQKQLEMQKMLKDELVRLESRYEDRMQKMKKDEEFRKDEENVREKRTMEERMWKKEELDRQEKQMMFEREMADREIQKEQEKAEIEMIENMKKFEMEMASLQAENENLRREHELAIEMERQKLAEKQDLAVRKIQRVFRGYRVRKDVGPLLLEPRETRKKQKEELRIKEVEIEIEKRKEEQKIKEEEERQRKEEEKRQKEELKRQKEEEKKRLEEEKRLKKEEAERIKQEEKRKKEEEKQRKKEEERKRKEEEKLKKEEEKRRKEEEKRQKEEEKRQKEAEEKKRKEEEELKKKEEKQKLEEEKKQQVEEQKRKEENEKLKLESEIVVKVENLAQDETKNENIVKEDEKNDLDKKSKEEKTEADTSTENVCVKIDNNLLDSETKSANNNNICETPLELDEKNMSKTSAPNIEKQAPADNPNDISKGNKKSDDIERTETPRSSRKPKSARSRPSTPRKGKKEIKTSENKEDIKKSEINVDCLPPDLELLRLNFIKDCLPWSKVSNEPWKLKAGLSRKPLRRPSSAKKIPPIPDDMIIQSAKVASLKMVTTVELHDLPGNNISTLGQCGGLKYLTLNHCNIIALDGLSQCRHLQYINVKNNKIEYIDLKDLGQLQYLNLSQNKLSSIHGLDSCTNLRWLDLSYNNITKLGGMDTLRRLFYMNISHCQLISTQGLSVVPTLQMLDISNNHLQMIEDIDKLCLLLTLNASANNILQIPNFKNQVLLIDLDLSNNSLSTLSGLGSIWLPLLCSLKLDQNSLTDLPILQNCLLLKELNLIENQITDTTTVLRCVDKCFYLEELNVLDNPVVADLDDSYYSKLKITCPRLSNGLNTVTERQGTPLKPRNSIETMCLSQQSAFKDSFMIFQQNISSGVSDQITTSDIYYKFCDKLFNMAVDYRYIHEYGEVSFIPSAPTIPKSGRPLSARQREKFMNPKDLFENALKSSENPGESNHLANKNESTIHNDPKDLFENALKSQSRTGNLTTSNEKIADSSKPFERRTDVSVPKNSYSNPKDLFEQALKSADNTSHHSQANGHTVSGLKQGKGGDIRNTAAVTIQAAWRGYRCRKSLGKHQLKEIDIDPALVERVYNSAVKIQANWRGYILRKKLLAALEYAQCDFGDDNDVDDDMMDFGDEFDFEKFVDVNQDLLDADWRPPSTPDIPNNYAVLRKPPSGKQKVPPINTTDLHPPNNPRRAWRNLESPLSDLGGKIPRPPSSVASTELTMRSAVSKKEEKMAEEWGFKDNSTAHLMMQRAKKMKYNSERRKKINKLDPKQRLALFRKLEEVTRPAQYTIKPSRKTLPRKEYFQARQEEIVRQEREKHEEYQVKASRTFEWLHSQVGDHVVTDSVINQRHTEGPKYINPENNLPELIGGGKRIHLVSSPMSIELQSVDSVSSAGKKGRRFSAGSGSSTSKLPPIQPTSAPVPQVKEKMSFRNAPVNQSVGWGGGKKRGHLH